MNYQRLVIRTSILTLAFVAAACGRSPTLPGFGADSGTGNYDARPGGQDLTPPVPDGLILPDNLPPPPDQGPQPPDLVPPLPDLSPTNDILPPVPDAWIPQDQTGPPLPDGPGPKPDVWPWPSDTAPPLPDMPIPPDQGPCSPTCTQMCTVLISCGLIKETYNQCVTNCLKWPAAQTTCLTNYICQGVSSCVPYSSCLTQPTKPDLVSTLTASASGSTVTYTAKTCNQGKAAASGNFYVDVYYNPKSKPTNKKYGNQFKQHKSLAAGACVTDTFTRKNTPAGTYKSYVQVDSDNYVAEANETNNVAGPVTVTVKTGPPPVKGPDLVIKSMSTYTYTIFGTTAVRYRVTVCNNGTVDAAASQVDVYYNQKSAPKAGAKGNTSRSVPALKAGNCTTRDLIRTGVGKGTYTSWAYVDTGNKIKETDETNNAFGPVTVSTSGTSNGDLKITSFTYQAYAYNTVLYRITVCNVGAGATGSTSVGLYYNLSAAPTSSTKPDRTSTVAVLQPKQCSTRYITRVQTKTGTYNSWAFVDPSNYIKETDEKNNIKGPLKVTVGGAANKPDLYFKSFSAKMNGTKLDYTMVVCNKGKSAATPFRVDLYYNLSAAPKAKQSGGQMSIVPVLNAGSCRTITRSRNNPPTGTTNAYAYADSWQWVSETDEKNNVAGPVKTTISLQGCTTLCMFATYCGLFKWSAFPQCLNWCKGLDSKTKTCAQNAQKSQSCSALKKCNLPKPPPPPPSPLACYSVCNWLTNTCKFVPSGQTLTCSALCMTRTSAQVACAQKAQKAKNCLQGVTCLLF